MDDRIYKIEWHIGGCDYEVVDSADNFKEAVEMLDIHRDNARKNEHSLRHVFRLVKRVETVYDV